MKIEQLPSGSYRVRKMSNGKAYSVTFDHKPNQHEIIQALADVMDDAPKGSFMEYTNKYLAVRGPALSPATLRGYRTLQRGISDTFMELQLNRITDEQVQIEVNRYASTHAPKSTHNFYGFITAVLTMYRPHLRLTTKLPQLSNEERDIPTDKEVALVLELTRGTQFEVPIWLAATGMRLSEICALQPSDVSGRMVTINKALVPGPDQKYYIKNSKTKKSTRTIAITPYVADLIQKQGYVYDGYPNSITRALHRFQRLAGVSNFTLHDLRHYYVSFISDFLPEADVLKMSGHSTPHVMKKIYRHSRINKDEESKKVVSDLLDEAMSKNFANS